MKTQQKIDRLQELAQLLNNQEISHSNKLMLEGRVQLLHLASVPNLEDPIEPSLVVCKTQEYEGKFAVERVANRTYQFSSAQGAIIFGVNTMMSWVPVEDYGETYIHAWESTLIHEVRIYL